MHVDLYTSKSHLYRVHDDQLSFAKTFSIKAAQMSTQLNEMRFCKMKHEVIKHQGKKWPCAIKFSSFQIFLAVLSRSVRSQQCEFPESLRRTWWVDNQTTAEFTDGDPGTVVFSGNQSQYDYTHYHKVLNEVSRDGSFQLWLTDTVLTCQGFHVPDDQWRYFVSLDPSNTALCHRVYVDNTALVYITAPYPGIKTLYRLSTVCF